MSHMHMNDSWAVFFFGCMIRSIIEALNNGVELWPEM